VKIAAVLGALVLAVLLQTTLAGLSFEAASRVNFVLVAVIYVALVFGAVAGIFAGAAGGLVQDAIAGGIVGIGGMTKTLAGFVVGVLGAQFIVSQPTTRFVLFVGATILHEVCFQALFALVEGQAVTIIWATVVTQAVVNGLVGILAFQVIEGAPGLMQRRAARRASVGRRRY
jgi:rod shape-determining protein MreD